MNAKEFKDLTGEDPEDVFGGDWENEIEKFTVDDYKKAASKDCECLFCINHF